jgi:prefoldin subunit 5
MVEATDIEKKSLEAHVELCAERYNALEDKIAVLDGKITSVSTMIRELKETVGKMAEKNNDRLITWGIRNYWYTISHNHLSYHSLRF